MGPRMECGFCEGPFKEHWLNTRVHSQWPQFLSLHPSLLSQLPTFSSLWASCHAIWDFFKTESTLSHTREHSVTLATLSQVLLLIKLCRQCFQHSLTMLSRFLSTMPQLSLDFGLVLWVWEAISGMSTLRDVTGSRDVVTWCGLVTWSQYYPNCYQLHCPPLINYIVYSY